LLRAWRAAGRPLAVRLAVQGYAVVPSRSVAVSCRTVRLCVVINRVLPGAAVPRPGSRQRATGLVQGAAGLPMVSGELSGSTCIRARPRLRESLRGPAARRLPHAAAAQVTAPPRPGTRISPAAIRASHGCPVVMTAHSQRSSVAAHAVRACPSASRFPSRPVQRACLAARTLLWRSAPQTARQAAGRRAGRPRREIRVCPLIVADVCSEGFRPACLTTARPT